MNNLIIAIDIGNTNTTLGVIDIKKLTCIKSYSFQSQDCKSRVSEYINRIHKEFREVDSFDIKVSSVIKSIRQELVLNLSSIPYINTINLVKYHKNLPIKIKYKNPESLGTDRIANCLYGFKKYPKQDLILLDAGTAITVDFLSSSGEFCGGFILPGISLQLHTLYKGTAELPKVSQKHAIRAFPPTSTHAAIKNGICLEIAGGVSFIVKKLIGKYPATQRILACGGMWKSIEDIVEFRYIYVPELTRIGIGLFEE